MKTTVLNNLSGRHENYILPFFWQHGEDEATLRGYMRVIHGAGIGAVCVESRPHPDYCGPIWWRDMDIILEEAKALSMKVWILDDSHFPTGYANGAVIGKPAHLRRQSICRMTLELTGNGKAQKIDIDQMLKKNLSKFSIVSAFASNPGKGTKDAVYPDELVALIAVGPEGQRLDLTDQAQDGPLSFIVPQGKWQLVLLKRSWRMGPHPTYINMTSKASCQLLIDAVYEPHYAHYKEEFGKTIAGFFSDEPELGNGAAYSHEKMGFDQDLPWSDELKEALKARWGEDWRLKLPLLWDAPAEKAADKKAKKSAPAAPAAVTPEAAAARYEYMDELTHLVQSAFSEPLGEWCRARGVQYIGHVVEDMGGHARTGGALGHYFRGLWGQDMAGIDDIGGQVFPYGEDENPNPNGLDKYMARDGSFYHYELPQLASSLAALDPKKAGRAMCEIFGNYGWSEGLRMEKYLADHFMVYGVNHYVPHAFSAKAFPDPDCPPHFYAHGQNPQYRHFRSLMDYMNRICGLISDGRRITDVAVLYHAEPEWMGTAMNDKQVLRALNDRQISTDIVPADALCGSDEYPLTLEEGRFDINRQSYQALIVPYAQYITAGIAKAIRALRQHRIPVYFVDGYPEQVIDTEIKKDSAEAASVGTASSGAGSDEAASVDAAWLKENCECVPLTELADHLANAGLASLKVAPANDRLRVLHYEKNGDLYYFVNEGKEAFRGTVTLPSAGECYRYDAWRNVLETAPVEKAVPAAAASAEEPAAAASGTILHLTLEPMESYLLIFGDAPAELAEPLTSRIARAKGAMGSLSFNGSWQRSLAKSLEYPLFKEDRPVSLPDHLATDHPNFSGWARYENTFTLSREGLTCLEIIDAYEGVEVYINGESLGVQVVPPYRYDISSLIHAGENTIRIDVSTTLERQMAASVTRGVRDRLMERKEKAPTGITGSVLLYQED